MKGDEEVTPGETYDIGNVDGKKYIAEDRHRSLKINQRKIVKWRLRERMKTGSVALVICLNTGVDPPDVIKTEPCARMECWHDPLLLPKGLETVGKALQAQYERWQSKARYRMSLDPTVDDVKKLCLGLRRNAKDERTLFHYNGHGVPKPTNNGELWVFNKTYTQYIPLSIYELQTWLGSPSFYVFDCSGAGLIVNWFLQFAEQREKEYERMISSSTTLSPGITPIKDFIILASCGPNELLPMNPSLPADVFTSCLTTPIKIALKWFCSTSVLAKQGIDADILEKIPGRLSERKSPLGELNWIFTAITDTIAWNTLPGPTFQKLFRQDLLVASLFRNFLLADRMMRSLNCTPMSFPKLPQTYQHPMWQAWDLAVDVCLSQIPDLLADPAKEYKPNPFFSDQLRAFEVWLEFGSEKRKPPEQLPIVLQVFLSPSHRKKALDLLGRFLDLGTWAINQALSVGIFPYVLKLLTSPSPDLRYILVFIWTKILALDKSCQLDLVKDNGHSYFINVLASPSGVIPAEEKAMAAFILSVIANNCRPGQIALLDSNLLQICVQQVTDPDPSLRRWTILCIGKLWESFEDAKQRALELGIHEKLTQLINDAVPEVRAAAVYSLGIFIGGGRAQIELNLGLLLTGVTFDASPMVRKTLIEALSRLTHFYGSQFKEEVGKIHEDSHGKKKSGNPEESPAVQDENIWICLWRMIVALTSDPNPDVAKAAERTVNSIREPIPISSGSSKNFNLNTSTSNLKSTTKPTNSKSLFNKKGSTSFLSSSSKENGSGSFSGFGSLSSSNGVKLKDVKDPKDPKEVSSPASPLKKTQSVDFSKLNAQDEEVEISWNEGDTFTFYEWSCEFYLKPIMKSSKETLDGKDFSQKLWKQQRNALILNHLPEIQHAFELKTKNVKPRFDEQVALIENSPEATSSIIFHPFEPTLIIADDKDGINVWDYETNQRVSQFRNRSTENANFNSISRTAQMIILNERDDALLLCGSEDGIIRIWDGFDERDPPKLVSTWRPTRALPHGARSTGLVMNWQQEFGLLTTSGAGDPNLVRIWDLQQEVSIQSFQLPSDNIATAMSSGVEGSRTLVVGCSDGTILTFDRRSSGKMSPVSVFKEHTGWVVNVKVPKSDGKTMISGTVNGTIKTWDLGLNQSIRTIPVYNKGVMTSFDVHDWVPVISCGSQNQKIKVVNMDGEDISLIRYHDGFLGQRVGPITSVAFHPYRLLMAAGAIDCLVSVYTRPQF
eukprot:TRINITY_DN876_c0_g1_i1.p1 TRINITY_DN876_c0_g1~~TRINITY_DN876_c0_g1_i1.p1  ORF type:complete len:1236 (+),score=415.18 TRINITY_DN876_c0_g1_i1:59-3766(+)